MNKYYAIIVFVLLSAFFIQCGNKKQSETQTADSTTSDVSSASGASADAPVTGRLSELGLTTNSDWRGINVGDDFTKVRATEKAELFENDDKHLGYTVEFKNLESADMLYFQANQKVSGIEVDLFLNTRQSVEEYQKELGTYFSSRYGTSKPDNGVTTWATKSGGQVTLKDVSKGKDFGLKIKIAPIGGAMTASVK